MNTLNDNTAGSILNFLTPKDASNLAQTSKFFRNVVVTNQCEVLSSGVWCWGEYAKRNQWEDLNRTTTKAMALRELEKLKKNEKLRTVTIYHYEAPIGWVANRAAWKIEWERDNFWKECEARVEPERDIFGNIV